MNGSVGHCVQCGCELWPDSRGTEDLYDIKNGLIELVGHICKESIEEAQAAEELDPESLHNTWDEGDEE